MPDQPGSDLKNIFVMRDYTDSHGIHSLLSPDKHVVVLGLGFIGMEAAIYCVDKCASVTVIGRDTVPLKPVFGADIGNRIQKEQEAKGDYAMLLRVVCIMYIYVIVTRVNRAFQA